MPSKAIVFGFVAACVSFTLIPTTPQNGSTPKPTAPATNSAEIARLRAALDEAKDKIDAARSTTKKLRTQLDECMDFLITGTNYHQGCRASRRMLTHYRWMHDNGHDKHAAKIVDLVAKQREYDAYNLTELARSLMTSKKLAGKNDALALALCKRATQKGARRRHNHRHHTQRMHDTSALAHFLNGHVAEAIALQKQAVAGGRSDSEYLRRLRTYEAAAELLPEQPKASLASSETPAEAEAEAATSGENDN